MTEQAALDENMPPVETVEAVATTEETGTETQAAPATATDEGQNLDPNFIPEDEIGEKTRARLNKITADKYAEKRRADALQAKLDELSSQPIPVQTATSEPTLEQHDYDESAYTAALIDYKVKEGLAQNQQQQTQQAQEAAAETTFNSFQEKVMEFQKQAPDFEQVTALVPDLQPETLEAVMQHPKAAEIAYYLGKHLDVADEVVNMSPIQAAIKLGEISAQLTATPQTVKPSAAPAPIEPVGSGGVLNKAPEDMSMEEIFNS